MQAVKLGIVVTESWRELLFIMQNQLLRGTIDVSSMSLLRTASNLNFEAIHFNTDLM